MVAEWTSTLRSGATRGRADPSPQETPPRLAPHPLEKVRDSAGEGPQRDRQRFGKRQAAPTSSLPLGSGPRRCVRVGGTAQRGRQLSWRLRSASVRTGPVGATSSRTRLAGDRNAASVLDFSRQIVRGQHPLDLRCLVDIGRRLNRTRCSVWVVHGFSSVPPWGWSNHRLSASRNAPDATVGRECT